MSQQETQQAKVMLVISVLVLDRGVRNGENYVIEQKVLIFSNSLFKTEYFWRNNHNELGLQVPQKIGNRSWNAVSEPFGCTRCDCAPTTRCTILVVGSGVERWGAII